MAQDRQIRGDQDRLATWVHEHARAVRGYLLALVRNADVADDLSQEVFRRAWQAHDRYLEQGTPRAYLLKIADRLACDWGRKVHRELHLDASEWRKIEPACEGEEPPALLSWEESERELAAALESLSPPQRRVLLLRYYGDLSFQEIAETMCCPLSTALSHCRRGLLALRAQLVEK
jgi:RNA polymerase sigma factor (sigma-70 family)